MPECTFLRAALRYAAHGIAVVPTIKGTKKPHSDDDGKRKVLTEPDEIRHWWGRWPDAEISLACGEVSGFDALDVDKQHGGFESLHKYEDEHGPIPRAAYQRTPSGGFHVLFQHQAGLKNWCGGQKTAPAGLDRRGERLADQGGTNQRVPLGMPGPTFKTTALAKAFGGSLHTHGATTSTAAQPFAVDR